MLRPVHDLHVLLLPRAWWRTLYQEGSLAAHSAPAYLYCTLLCNALSSSVEAFNA